MLLLISTLMTRIHFQGRLIWTILIYNQSLCQIRFVWYQQTRNQMCWTSLSSGKQLLLFSGHSIQRWYWRSEDVGRHHHWRSGDQVTVSQPPGCGYLLSQLGSWWWWSDCGWSRYSLLIGQHKTILISVVAGPLTRRAIEEGTVKGRNGLGSIYVWASGNGGKFEDNW